MKKRDLLIGIPTKNHSKYIMYWLSKILDDALKNNIDIGIFDASEDDKTEMIVKNRIKQGYTNLFYKRFSPDSVLEDRLEEIYVNSGYRYVWLCGDGIVLNMKKIVKIVNEEIEKKRDLIVFGQDKKYVKTYKEYNNSVEFCKECFTPTTLFGGVIIRGDLVDGRIFSYCKKKYSEQAVPGIYYELFKDGKISAVYYCFGFFEFNPYKQDSIAMQEKRMIYAFAQLFTETIWKLPAIYNPVKGSLEKALAYTTGLYKWEGLLAMRVNGNLSLKIYLEYRKFLKIASEQSPVAYIIVSLCPVEIAKKIAMIYGITA